MSLSQWPVRLGLSLSIILTYLDTALAPSVGTEKILYGSYTIMMVDLDIPSANGSSLTSERLHWMQSDLSSASSTSTIGNKTVYALVNTVNASAFASYEQPSPPDLIPLSHRYTQYLLNTTLMPEALIMLANISAVRSAFNSTTAISTFGIPLVAGNWFNVTNQAAIATSATSTTSLAQQTSTTDATSFATFLELNVIFAKFLACVASFVILA